MKSMARFLIHAAVLSSMLVSCGDGDDGNGWYDVTDFRLINTYNHPTRLTLLYPKSIDGDVVYIESTSDLGIVTVNDFNNSTATKTTKTVTSDDNIYDDYITSLSYGSLKKVYLYVLYRGAVRVFTGTTSISGSSAVTDSVTGSTAMTVTATLPAGYSDTSKEWPLIVSLKGPTFSDLPCITICINISWSNNTQYDADLSAIKSFVNSAIEGGYKINGESLRINRDKIYGFGFSAGGCAVMQFANDDLSNQYEFNAVIGVGISSWVGQYYSENMGDKNIWLFAGGDDSWGTQTIEAYGYLPDGNGEHLLTEMPGVGHTSNPVLASPYMYMWLLSK